MLTFKLISFIDGYYHYEYYPEDDRSNIGTLIYNPVEKKVKKNIRPKSKFDCLGHFLQGVRDKEGNFRKEGMVAWY